MTDKLSGAKIIDRLEKPESPVKIIMMTFELDLENPRDLKNGCIVSTSHIALYA